MVYSTGCLSTQGRKEMNPGVFGIGNVGCFGGMVVDGKLGQLGYILRKILDDG